jgi:hypothetical protein
MVYVVMEYERSFRVTRKIWGPWSETQDQSYFADESMAVAFVKDYKSSLQQRDIYKRPSHPWAWVDPVMLLRIEGEYYDLGGKCIQIQALPSGDPGVVENDPGTGPPVEE